MKKKKKKKQMGTGEAIKAEAKRVLLIYKQ